LDCGGGTKHKRQEKEQNKEILLRPSYSKRSLKMFGKVRRKFWN
jgi:hypothetical protein